MKIQIGEICLDRITEQKICKPNKTRKYILPCLKEYGKEFESKINSVFKVAAGIGDMVVTNRKDEYTYEREIFILVDTSMASLEDVFADFLEYIRNQPMYVNDYIYDNVQESTFHMVVVKMPAKYYSAYDSFIKGRFSQMYDRKKKKKHFDNYPREKKVFLKNDHDYKVMFVGKLNEIFGSEIHYSQYDGELELPPIPETDVFNHHLKQ